MLLLQLQHEDKLELDKLQPKKLEPDELEPDELEPEKLEPDKLDNDGNGGDNATAKVDLVRFRRMQPEDKLEPEELEPDELEPAKLESDELELEVDDNHKDVDDNANKDDDVDLDATLRLHQLQWEDQANYTCKVITSQSGSKSATTSLRVLHDHKASSFCSDAAWSQDLRNTTQNDRVLRNPEPKNYDWSMATGALPPSAVPQGSRLPIQPTEESISTTSPCSAIGLTSINFLIPGSPPEPLTLLIGFWVSVIMLVAVLGFLVRYWRKRQSRQDLD